MSAVRPGSPGATRVCPHCKATVLESAAVCPGCHHHLRFSGSGAPNPDETYSALSVDGTISHQASGEPCEYCIVVDVRSERGEPLVRQVVGVGVLQPGDLRRVNVSIDMMPVRTSAAAKAAAKAASAPAPAPAPLAAKAASTVAAGAPSAPATPAPQPARPAATGAHPGQAPSSGADAAKSGTPPLLNPPQPGAKPPSGGPLMQGRPTQRMRIFPKR
jgi:hypothetical protein